MNGLFAVLLLAAVAVAFDPHDLFPCSFEAMTVTSVMSGGSEQFKSFDSIYHDHDNLWRWDSQCDGFLPFFEGHEWSVIWRPDDGVSYHEDLKAGKCLKNNGESKMYPYPYEWIASHVDSVSWSSKETKYNGRSAIKYTGVSHSTEWDFDAKFDIYIAKKSGDLLYANGTVETKFIDVTFSMTVTKFVSHSALALGTFVPSARCPATTVPASASKEFQRYCYESTNELSSSGAAVIKPSLAIFLATLLMALLILVAM